MDDEQNKQARKNRLPSLTEVLSRRTRPPFDLFTFYLFLQREDADDILDFWLDVQQHENLSRAYFKDVRKSGRTIKEDWPQYWDYARRRGSIYGTVVGLQPSVGKPSNASATDALNDPEKQGLVAASDEKRAGGRSTCPTSGLEKEQLVIASPPAEDSPRSTTPFSLSAPTPTLFNTRRASRAPTIIPRSAAITRMDLVGSAERIYFRYLSPAGTVGAPENHEIYLPPALRIHSFPLSSTQAPSSQSELNILAHIPDMFHAQKEYCFRAMEQDAFPRFLRAKAFRNLIRLSPFFRLVHRPVIFSRRRAQESSGNSASSVRSTRSVGGSTQPSTSACTSHPIPQDTTNTASTRSTEDHGSRTCKRDSDDAHDNATFSVAPAPSWRPTLSRIVTTNITSIDSASTSTEQHSIQHLTAHSSDHSTYDLTPSSPARSNANLSPAISDASFSTTSSKFDSSRSDSAQSPKLIPGHVVYERREAVNNLTDAGLSGSTTVPASHLIQTLESHAREWTKTKLVHDPWKDVLASAADFTLPRVTFYQIICEHLETSNCITDAAECFCQMKNELGAESNLPGEHSLWALDFKQRICRKLEFLGDTAVGAQRYGEATSHYTTVLSLDPPSPQNILMKRSKAYTAIGSWEQGLDDANQVITLDPSSPWGYEMKHAALHIAGDYDNAVDAFESMLSIVERSSDPEICQRRDRYKTPSSIRTRIRRIIQQTLRDSPHALINTATGRLYNRDERASAFESLPIFNELVSSMTTRSDRARIKHEVRQYFQYVVLSHKWEDNEPSFQQVIHVTVYDLEKCPTHDKLQTFCKIAQDAGFQWAWSDTCCIDTGKHDVHQEALVAMFKWYRGSAMMIVFLRGVPSSSQRGALAGSIWNTRGWTLQEYIAAKVIHFYTEDWTLYLNLESPNHKEAPEVISEMEQSTGVSSQQLKALRPGLTNIREKLCLASTRQTTRVEDTAYSLLGIFSVTGIPAIYGEGEAALGRLLSHILTGSGDVSILAWTGESGSFNSCLPAHITVFNRPAASHLPPPIEESEMVSIITRSQTSSFDLDVALKLYNHLSEVPPPWFATSRMKLPCIMFQLPSLGTPRRTRSGRIYHVDTVTFGMVEIKTRHDLSRLNSLYLVHPWLDTLLEPDHTQSMEDHDVPPSSPDTDEDEISYEETYRYSVPSGPSRAATMHSVNVPVPLDKETLAQRLVARLRQPFGALLVTPMSTGRRAADYRRVAADSLIIVRFQNAVPLAELLDSVRVLDIL